MNIVHFITGLNTGGAEKMLFKYLANSNQKKDKQIVIYLLSNKGNYAKKIESLGIKVISLGLSKKNIFSTKFISTFLEIKKFPTPDIKNTNQIILILVKKF